MHAPAASKSAQRTGRARPPLTVGIEEEVLLLDPLSGAPVPRAQDALTRLDGDPRFTGELPAAQLEIRLPPARTVPEALQALCTARHDLAAALLGLARPAAAGVHPCAPIRGPLTGGERYETLRAEFGPLAELQQVASLQVHIHVGDPERTIHVHDALREYLPDIAALAANAPVYGGCDTGLASVRPLICRLLPRQGVPPALGDAKGYEAELAWGTAAGIPDPGMWWWELRPHPVYGTLEIRVADAQTTIGGARAVVAFVTTLVAALCDEIDRAGPRSPVPTWRIEENRWAACRDGLGATFTDVRSGERVFAADRLQALTETLEPVAERLACADELAAVRHLIATGGGAAAQRRDIFAHGLEALPGCLADRYLREAM